MDMEKSLTISCLNKISNLLNNLDEKHDLIYNDMKNTLLVDKKIVDEDVFNEVKIKNNNIKNEIINSIIEKL